MFKITANVFLALLIFVFFIPTSFASSVNDLVTQKYEKIKPLTPHLSKRALTLALTAYYNARMKGFDDKEILTVVDFSDPSSDKRLWVLDLKNDRLLYHTFVTHGSGSGYLYAKHFSNIPGTNQSSLGLFLTQNSYYGQVGYALRLEGLDQGINSNAKKRAIVVHGAKYADQNYVDKYGRLGRSWGCFALAENMYHTVINTIRNGTLIFAYYPDNNWIQHSQYLHSTTPVNAELL